MIKITKIDNLQAAHKIHYHNRKLYTYSNGLFYKSMLDGTDIETLPFGDNTQIYSIKSDVVAYIETGFLKVGASS